MCLCLGGLVLLWPPKARQGGGGSGVPAREAGMYENSNSDRDVRAPARLVWMICTPGDHGHWRPERADLPASLGSARLP